jgi:hypothetical protein
MRSFRGNKSFLLFSFGLFSFFGGVVIAALVNIPPRNKDGLTVTSRRSEVIRIETLG